MSIEQGSSAIHSMNKTRQERLNRARAQLNRKRGTGADVIGAYLKDIDPLSAVLSDEEESELRGQYQTGVDARFALTDFHGTASERTILQRQSDLGALAEQQLFLHNTRLVVSIAKKFIGRGVPLADLIQEGNLGLLSGIQHMQPDREGKLSTYFTTWIQKFIIEALENMSGPTNLPEKTFRLMVQMDHIQHKNMSLFGERLTDEALMASLGIDEERLKDIQMAYGWQTSVGLNSFTRVKHESSKQPVEQVEDQIDDTQDSVQSMIEQQQMQQQLQSHLERLRPNDREAVEVLFEFDEHPLVQAMDPEKKLKFDEKAALLNITKNQLTNIRLRVFKQLQQAIGTKEAI